jgi:Periplasmic binding proteins and sugar binding domain of LacI family
MVPELGIPYFAELAALVIVAAQARDWNVLIEQTRGTRDRERATLASLGPHLIDGAIISPEALHADDLTAHHPGVPMVMLGEHALDVEIDRVAIDNVRAARTAVTHLVELRRRRIACIGDNPRRGTAALRLEGYRTRPGRGRAASRRRPRGPGRALPPPRRRRGHARTAGAARPAGRRVLLQRHARCARPPSRAAGCPPTWPSSGSTAARRASTRPRP